MFRDYPCYNNEEEEHFKLWSIDDGSWEFYGHDPSLMKESHKVNDKYSSDFTYYCGDYELFKLVYKNYEGVFSKKKITQQYHLDIIVRLTKLYHSMMY